MELYKQNESKYWTADFVVDGHRYRKSTKQTTKARAGEVAAEFLRQASRNQLPVRKDQTVTLRQFAEEYFLPAMKTWTLAPKTKACYQHGWNTLKNSFGQDIVNLRLNCITTSLADGLKIKGSGSNQNCALRTLRRILSHGVEEGIIQVAPRIKLREENERTAIWDAKTEEAFLKVAPQPLLDVFLICHDSGMRPSEIISLKWENILWDKSQIFVREGKTENARRYVPLSDRVRKALQVRSDKAKTKIVKSDWIFPATRKNSKTGHLSLTGVEKPFRKARKAANLPQGSVFYSTRHSFATDLLKQTGNIKLVGNVLGHSSVTTTEKYTHPDLTHVADAVNLRNIERANEIGMTYSAS